MTAEQARGHPPIWRALLFAAVFGLLQWGWSSQHDGALFDLWVEHLNVRSAVALIGALQPDAGAYAEGVRIRAPGGGLNVLQGCDGAELLWLLTAAFVVAPLPWLWRLGGWLAGLLLVWLLNVGRIASLFFAWRADPHWFDWLHNYIGPLLLIALLALYVHWVMQRAPQPDVDAQLGYK